MSPFARRLFALPGSLGDMATWGTGNVFPLLSRELTEQAARRRTFVVRVVYAVVLYVVAIWIFYNQVESWSSRTFTALGQGLPIFIGLGWLQFFGIYLFLPPMTCGVLTAEKERDTLSLLMLTRLGPWSILIGKLFSRMITMASFICLSLPLFAVAYSFGGVEATQILSLGWGLAVTSLQIGSLALACSAWCRTTGSAFLATYLIGAFVIAAPNFVTQGGNLDHFGILEFLAEYCRTMGFAGDEVTHGDVTLVLFGPWVCLDQQASNRPFAATVARTVPMLLSAAVCLFFARAMLWRRAFVAPSNVMLKMFRSLDTLFHRLNQNRLTRGIVLTREHVQLPLYDPIRWRETKKRSLGTTRYLIRLLLVLEIPVLFGMLIPFYGDVTSNYAPAFVAAWIVWVISALVIAIHATGLIGLERSRQTMDVLLTTPLTSESIVKEKFAGISRMIVVLWIPLATVYLYQVWWTGWVGSFEPSEILFGILRGLLAMSIYPWLIAWIGFHFGMRCRSQAQAVLVTLSVLTAVCVIPAALATYLHSNGLWTLGEIGWLSPAMVLTESTYGRQMFLDYRYSNNFNSYLALRAWGGLFCHFFLAGLLLLWLRLRVLRTFAGRLGRNDGQIIDDDDIERLSELRRQILKSGIFRTNPNDE
ncbi:MAG: gliding motility-associated transporter permease protein [Schlesneria sp.]|nr:gliding motility-associated transporter permease protein [Schlesneria sp.]